MIEPRKAGISSDLAICSVLLIKYRALARLVEDRERYVATGRFRLEGAEREARRHSQWRVSRQFPGALAELEELTAEQVSALISTLRSIIEGKYAVSKEGRCVLNAVCDYHFALHWLMNGGRECEVLPPCVREGKGRGGSSQRVGSWVREKYGLGKRCRVWILDIGWMRGG